MGAPNTVFFMARRAGAVRIDVMTGDPFQGPRTTSLEITVVA